MKTETDTGLDSGQGAGRYRREVAGYRASIPRPLPPDPPVRMEGEFQRLLARADRALGCLDGSIRILPEPDRFVFLYVRREAVLSCRIECARSSLRDVLAAEAGISAPDRPADAGEVIDYVEAMNHGLERLRELPLCIPLIHEIHERLLTGARGGRPEPGELRRPRNRVGMPDRTPHDFAFAPPPPDPDEVAPALGALENFLHNPGDLPELVQIGLAHAQFEIIHPFPDGNGLVGRLLIAFFLHQQNILRHPVLCLSHYFMQHRDEYYRRLQAVRDLGDWEGWLNFFVEGVIDASREAAGTARQILALREDHRQRVADGLGRAAGNGHRILERLYRNPFCSVAEIQRFLGITYAGANSLVSRLAKLGLLQETTGQKRHRVFRYGPYLDLFGDTRGPSAP